MKAKLLAFTLTPGFKGNFDLNEALGFCAKMAGICYMSDDFSKILSESEEDTKKRMDQTLNSGHHSVYDHFKLTFEFSEISKVIAMFLNNEHAYDTSEKSARFTHFGNLVGIEGKLYNKWYEKLKEIIKKAYPSMYNPNAKNPMLKIEKLSQENARYFVSVFSRTTTMGHTFSLRQLNYIVEMMQDYCDNVAKSDFELKVADEFKEFISLFSDYMVPSLKAIGKCRRLSLFGESKYKDVPDIFSYVYQTSYKASFASIAQNQRHRTEKSFIYFLDNYEFYIPEILEDFPEEKKEWVEDSLMVKEISPQGQLFKVVQTGDIDTLFWKCSERLCGQAQLEIMRTTLETYKKFISNSPYADQLLEKTNNCTARCKFSDAASCKRPCIFGKNQEERKI